MSYESSWERVKRNNMKTALKLQAVIFNELKENQVLELGDYYMIARTLATLTLTILQGERANQLGLKVAELEQKLSDLVGSAGDIDERTDGNPNSLEFENGREKDNGDGAKTGDE